jgi:acetoin utilization protein AcuB
MVAAELISHSIPPLKTSDSVQKAVNRMAEFRVHHLPIIQKQQFLGLISEDDILEIADYSLPIGAITLSLLNSFVYEDQHIYEVIRVLNSQKLTVVPVIDEKSQYKGLITIESLFSHFATITSLEEAGGIIVLEIGNRDNSLAHIAQIVESNDAQILSSYMNNIPNSSQLEITIKINKVDISQIVASFLRYDYVVKASYNHTNRDNGAKDRFDSLMNYLSFD